MENGSHKKFKTIKIRLKIIMVAGLLVALIEFLFYTNNQHFDFLFYFLRRRLNNKFISLQEHSKQYINQRKRKLVLRGNSINPV